MDQRIIDYIREELDRSLDNEAKRYDNSKTNYSSSDDDTVDDASTTVSRERYRHAPARDSNISKSDTRCNQKLQQRYAQFGVICKVALINNLRIYIYKKRN